MTAQKPRLRGMTWDHPRGVDPLVACSRIWRERTGVEIVWERRSLQDFESYPVAELAARYDLIVVDHPHVGQVTAEGCLAPLDVAGREAERAAMAAGSVGPSYPSYNWDGRQWAFPIDAAAQVQARRPDRLEVPLATWAEVSDAARRGLVLCPLRPPHSLMSLFTLCGLGGRSPQAQRPELFEPETAAAAYERLRELSMQVDPSCFELDPIAVLERLAAGETEAVSAPLIYGYVSYAREGFRAERIAFSDLPVSGAGPAGSAIGGTGIAVSAMSPSRDAAIDFAYWVAGGEAQAGPYAAGGGQPAHAAAWESALVNAVTGGFYAATRATLETSWLRPRHDGYMPFQHEASVRLNEQLKSGVPARQAISELNALFRKSLTA